MNLSKKLAIPLLALVVVVILIIIRMVGNESTNVARQAPATPVKAESPKRETIVHSITLTADVIPIQQAQIFSKVYGNLETVIANLGDFVRSGQLLAVIDTTELAQQYEQASASYQNALLTYNRTKTLVEKSLAAVQDLDNAEASMKVTKAAYDLAKTQLEYAKITAPFSGYITKRFLDPGAVLTTNNATLFTLMDLSSVKLIVNIIENEVPDVKVADKATVTVDAFPGRTFEGKISRVGQAVDVATRTMPVEIDILNKDNVLKPGMYATVELDLGEHPDAITVPAAAVLNDAGGYYVYTVENNTARRKVVTVGTRQESRTEILSGLDGTETVITTGQQFVKDGGRVTVQND